MTTRVRSRIAVLPDAHIDHHNPWAFEVLFRYLEERHWDWWVQLGDWIENYQQSSFVAGKDAYESLKQEFETAHSLTHAVHKHATAKNENAQAAWVQGNHERRWKVKLKEYGPVAEFLPTLEELVGFADITKYIAHCYDPDLSSSVFRLIPNRKDRLTPVVRRFGEVDKQWGVTFIHGQWHNVHAAKTHAERGWFGPNLHGHTHTKQRSIVQSMNGAKSSGHACGWLGFNASPAYVNRATAWQIGFAEVLFHGGDFSIIQHDIHWDGRTARLLADGCVYESSRSELYTP